MKRKSLVRINLSLFLCSYVKKKKNVGAKSHNYICLGCLAGYETAKMVLSWVPIPRPCFGHNRIRKNNSASIESQVLEAKTYTKQWATQNSKIFSIKSQRQSWLQVKTRFPIPDQLDKLTMGMKGNCWYNKLQMDLTPLK
jgi:hypothetical protein